jgi:acyl-CoA thioesterase YciA
MRLISRKQGGWMAYIAQDKSSVSTAAPLAGPRGELASRTLAMPADTNPRGEVFGGWIMSLMDVAGKMSATRFAHGRVATVAVSNIVFHRPVKVGDTVCCYTDLRKLGRTSITFDVEVWVLRQGHGDRVRVTDASFTFVALDDEGKPQPLVVTA